MADNNDEFKLSLIGELNQAGSKEQVDKDLETLSKNVNNLKLKVEIDDSQTITIDQKQITKLETQLGKLKVSLNDVNISKDNINRLIRQLNSELQNINVNIGNINANNIGRQVRQTGQQIGQLISDSAERSINNVSSNSIGKFFKIDPKDTREFESEMEKLVDKWTDSKGKLTDVKINTRTFYDAESDAQMTRLHQATVTYTNDLDEVIKKTIAWRQIGTTTNTKGEEEVIRGFVEVAGQYSKSLDTINTKTDNFVEKQKKIITDYQIKLNNLKTKYSKADIDYSKFESIFNNFKQGIGTVDELRLAFNALENSAIKGIQGLKSQSSSFDPVQQTLNNNGTDWQ